MVEISPLSIIIDCLADDSTEPDVQRWAQKMRAANPDQYPHRRTK
jgi:hypothetical protein